MAHMTLNRRWNGWGQSHVTFPLNPMAEEFLTSQLGFSAPHSDATLESCMALVPESRISHPEVTTDPLDRLMHARGQSLPDWIACRSGCMGPHPDGVAYPESREQVRELLGFAQEQSIAVIPYGGGTSVVGHINPADPDRPTLSLDMGHMRDLVHLDETSRRAHFGAGVRGPELESQLRAHGFTLGHFPQSFELSTLGGWVATRSSGQQSLRYGRIEPLFAGGHMETPSGPLDIPDYPASSANPDLHAMVLGSEGRMGVLTDVIVNISPLPDRERFHMCFFPSWNEGIQAVRSLAQSRLPLSMIRLSNELETRTQLLLGGHESQLKWLYRYLGWRGCGTHPSMLLMGVTGCRAACRVTLHEALKIIRNFSGHHLGSGPGRSFAQKRFQIPYLRNTLWEKGYAVDTLETATTWNRIPHLALAMERALTSIAQQYSWPIHVFSHLSHVYPSGASIYTTCVFPRKPDPDAMLAFWRELKATASTLIVKNGATISHQHGVGMDHAPYLKAEKGELAMDSLALSHTPFDPQRIMNPGKLY